MSEATNWSLALFSSPSSRKGRGDLHGPVLADPEKAFAVRVDLADQRDVGVLFEGNLVDPNRQDSGSVHVLPTTRDG